MSTQMFDPKPIPADEKLTIDVLRKEFKTRADSLGLRAECMMDGDARSEIVIVAEAPGDREVATGSPLIGGSGTMLWTTFTKALNRIQEKLHDKQSTPLRISRNTCYVTNVSKTQLSTNKGKRYLPDVQYQQWRALLMWELAQLPNVRYILVLGGYALRAFTGHSEITNWSGSVVPHKLSHVDLQGGRMQIVERDVTIACTFNPAYILRDTRMEPKFIQDVHRFISVVRGTFKPHVIDTSLINPSPMEAMQWCDKMIDEDRPVSLDIETMGNETACVGLGNTSHNGMCINFRSLDDNRWSIEDERRVRRRIQQVCNETQIIAQNGNFDAYWLWYKDKIRIPQIWFDTMLAHHTMYAILPHGLSFLTSQYTTHPYYKDDKDAWKEGGNIDEYWQYNIRDVAITYAVHLRLLEELRSQSLERFFFDHVMRLDPHLTQMTVGGILVDRDLKSRLADEMRDKVSTLLEEFKESARQVTGRRDLDINPNSPPQLSVLFYRDLGLRSRGSDTGKETRKRWLEDHRINDDTRNMLQKLEEYKTESTFLTRYVDAKIDEDSRMRCEYKQTGVASAPGRLSSAAVMWGSGGNLQNQPERAYEMFLADDDYCFVYFDLAQAEARVVAWLAYIPTWIEQFEKARIDGNYDCHRALASEMYGIPYDDVPIADYDDDGNRTIRYVSKRSRHGLNYRMAAARLALVTGLPYIVAQEAYTIYHRITPELKQWWDAVIQEVRENRVLFSPMGRPLRFFGRLNDEALDSIIAFKPQSTIGDKVKQIIYQCHDDPHWPHDAAIRLNVHDALIGLAPKKKAVKCLRIMKRYAEQPLTVNGMPLIIPADCKISVAGEDGKHRWSTLMKIDIQ